MTAPVKLNFKIYQGSTFNEVLRWESSTKVYKPITNITKTAPVVITAVGHGCPIGWRVKVTNVSGMKEINSDTNYNVVTEATIDTITLNAVNAAGYTAYVSGGILEYNKPVALTGMTARMQIREKIDSTTTLVELTTENGGIVIDAVNNTITLIITAAASTLLNFTTAVYSLELVKGIEVTPFISGNVSLVKEVTR
jgi:hypothetical protein